jgi:hypothetical protein
MLTGRSSTERVLTLTAVALTAVALTAVALTATPVDSARLIARLRLSVLPVLGGGHPIQVGALPGRAKRIPTFTF